MSSLAAEIEQFAADRDRLRASIGSAVVGHEQPVTEILTALFAGGHALLEGVPGLGKTLMVRTLARCLDLAFGRVQCTPDLMPADILGTTVLFEGESGGREFRFERGPVFAQILLADEVNRATPKTQSALLEAMQECAVTVSGARHPLPEPFLLLATQNPIEMEGTYPLPEAQLDRFLLKIRLTAPDEDGLVEIIDRTTGTPTDEPTPVLDAARVLEIRALVRRVELPEPVARYAARITRATHPDAPGAPEPVRRYVRYGASPRGAQALALAARVEALSDGRGHVAFADLRAVAPAALRHRLIQNFEGEAAGLDPDALVAAVLEAVSET